MLNYLVFELTDADYLTFLMVLIIGGLYVVYFWSHLAYFVKEDPIVKKVKLLNKAYNYNQVEKALAKNIPAQAEPLILQ